MSSAFVVLPSAIFLDPEIKPQVLRTLGVIATYADNRNHTSFCSYQTIGEKLGISRRLVIEYVKILCDRGYLQKKERLRTDGTNTTNIFTLVLNVDISIGSGEAGHHHVVKPDITQTVKPGITDKELSSSSNYKDKNINKKSVKLNLEAWEKKVGAQLSPLMMKSWLQENGISKAVATDLVRDFRERVGASGTLFAEFTLAFQNWLRRGFLMLTLAGAQEKSKQEQATHSDVKFYDKGLNL